MRLTILIGTVLLVSACSAPLKQEARIAPSPEPIVEAPAQTEDIARNPQQPCDGANDGIGGTGCQDF